MTFPFVLLPLRHMFNFTIDKQYMNKPALICQSALACGLHWLDLFVHFALLGWLKPPPTH